MRILVTGGAGFIGSHLCERLLAENHEVVCFDNFNDFYDPALKRANIEKALSHHDYSVVVGDILDGEALDKVFQDGFDGVFHLAAYAGVRHSIESPEETRRINVDGTWNLLERCRAHHVPRFIFISTSAVYGGRTEVPFKETDDVMRPVSPYAATKVAGEALCHTYHHLYGIRMQVLRLFTVYGPRQWPEMAIHRFVQRLKSGQPVPMYGDGASARDYTYIDDIIDGFMAALDRCDGFDVFNLGSTEVTRLSDLIRVIGDCLGVAPVIDQWPDQAGDVPITFADISKARHGLGYEPKVRLHRGVARFCEWLENEAPKTLLQTIY